MSFIPDSTKLKKVRQQEPPENHEMSAEKQLDQFATTETTLPAFQKEDRLILKTLALPI